MYLVASMYKEINTSLSLIIWQSTSNNLYQACRIPENLHVAVCLWQSYYFIWCLYHNLYSISIIILVTKTKAIN